MTKKTEKQMPQLTPEMFEAFQLFLEQMNQTENKKETTKTVKRPTTNSEKITKKYLRDKYKDRTITVTNATNGTVSYVSKKGGFPYVWSGYGDSDEVAIDDLLVMPPKYLTTPWLLIDTDEEEVIEGLGLTEVYKHIAILDKVDDIDSLTVEELEEACNVFVKKQNREFVHHMATRIQEAILKGELVDYRKIQQFGKILDKDFSTIKED